LSWVVRAPERALERAEKKLYTRVRRVLWDYEPLRASHAEIFIDVEGDQVGLRGRVRTLPQKLIANVLVERMTDVGAVSNELIADPDVVRAVADALAQDERTAAYVSGSTHDTAWWSCAARCPTRRRKKPRSKSPPACHS
jgi:hypothetical protein